MKKLHCTPRHRNKRAPFFILQLFSLLILSCIVNENLKGQSWLYQYPNIGTGMDIVEASNGDVLTFGFEDNTDIETSLTRINPEGEVVWQINFPSILTTWTPALVKTSDGNYVVAYQDSVLVDDQLTMGIVLQKIDDSGNDIWQKVHLPPSDNFDNIRSFIESNDGGLLLGGNFEYTTTAYVLKMDENGELEWIQEYPELSLTRAIQAQNDDLIYCGRSAYTNGENNAILYRTDSSGNPIWIKTFDNPNAYNFGASVIETIDNEIAYLLVEAGTQDTVSLIKMEMSGEEIWNTPFRLYSVIAEGSSKLLFQDADGVYSITNLSGFRQGGTPIIRIDEDGGLLTTEIAFGLTFYTAAMIPLSDGTYALTGSGWIPNVGAQMFVARTNTQGQIIHGTIQGNVFNDENSSCNWDSLEQGLSQWIVTATDISNQNAYSVTTDSIGDYELQLFDGTYEVSVQPPIPLWQVCPDSALQEVNINPSSGVIGPFIADFPAEAIYECPIMTVDIATPFLRRCFDNTYYVEYWNIGTDEATGAYIEVVLDDFMTIISASIPYENQMDTLLVFQVGDVDIGECGQFYITAYVNCDSTILGQTQCTEATIYPNDYCIPFDLDWDMSSIALNGYCENDSVYFEIINTGTGDMSAPLDYVIVIDEVIMFEDDFLLTSGSTEVIAVEATGETYRMEAEQAPNHPDGPLVSFTIDGCPEFGASGFVNWFPLDDILQHHDVDCQQNIGAYDPNDKKAYPIGYGNAHFIEPDTEIEYLIRFQNTGTDTAFQVVVRDSLSGHLDLNTIRMGVASHPYQWSIDNNSVLKVSFDNIMLPDSNVNEAASHGFFKFNISPKSTIEMGTIIENSADIYFDFNTPIITNTIFHTVDTNFVFIDNLILDQEEVSDIKIKVFPNPLRTAGHFVLDGYYCQHLDLEIYNAVGQLVKQQQGSGNYMLMSVSGLSKGIYFFRFYGDGNMLGTGQFIISG